MFLMSFKYGSKYNFWTAVNILSRIDELTATMSYTVFLQEIENINLNIRNVNY